MEMDTLPLSILGVIFIVMGLWIRKVISSSFTKPKVRFYRRVKKGGNQ